MNYVRQAITSGLPKLKHFSTQTVEIRVDYGLGNSAIAEFDFKAGNASRVDRDYVYRGIGLITLVREPGRKEVVLLS